MGYVIQDLLLSKPIKSNHIMFRKDMYPGLLVQNRTEILPTVLSCPEVIENHTFSPDNKTKSMVETSAVC